MVTRKKNGQSVDGAGSILSTVSGPSAAQPPSSLDSKNAVADQLLRKTGLIGAQGESMPKALAAFKEALAGQRSFARETDPPMV